MKRHPRTGYPIFPNTRRKIIIRRLSWPLRFALQLCTMSLIIVIGTACGAFLLSYFQDPRGGAVAQIAEWGVFFILIALLNECLNIYCAARQRLK